VVRSSAASDVYKRQGLDAYQQLAWHGHAGRTFEDFRQ
jgi:hypothetical protein